MATQIDVVLRGLRAEDAAARAWARARARHDGAGIRTVDAEDLAHSDATLAVVAHDGREGGAEVLEIVGRSRVPVVVVSTAEPLHSATELANRPVLPVAVGVPTGDDASRVLDVAADEAHAIGTDLTVVRVWQVSEWLSSADRAHAAEVTRSRVDDAGRLDAAVLHVHHRRPDLDVMSEFRDGDVYDWLRRIARRVECLVLGTGEHGDSAVARWALDHVTAPLILVDTAHDRAPAAAR